MTAWHSARWLLCAASLAVGACVGPARIETRLPPGAVVLATVGDGRAFAADGRGMIYVLDGTDGTVAGYSFVDRGQILIAPILRSRYGGRSGQGSSMVAPRGLDASDLLLLVADEGAGEVARFSTRGERASPITVPDVDGTVGLTRPDPAAPRGRPVAVVSRAGTVWVADAGRGHVLRFADGRLDGILGGPADGDAALARPSALALGRDGTLYVADGRRIQTFGPLGRPGAALPLDFDAASVAFGMTGDTLLVSGNADGAARLAVGPPEGPFATRMLDLGEPLRGALFYGNALVVLTPTRLIRLGP